ncbi:ATP-binding cassette domain-containing protein [Actinomadura barringtoniae]|uniref:ATP-binding cassette domain-containing protein n=1 Tax=Actinomadura barringtoniae TaxID=1427535 RepID=A0A939T3D0_9ACTN|nr:ATP-binding cassette domain-containing protein [Actinomadura barringtoniae]MBO2450951.1 ATP-binding cassette domain-containing protein [Actinomadura barringtoniae]
MTPLIESQDLLPARTSPEPSGVAVEADGLTLRGSLGWVYRDVSLVAAPGRLTALAGPAGSGRTCLLLTLTGRMKPTGGEARVGDHRLPRQAHAVQRISAISSPEGLNPPEPALTVRQQLNEFLHLHAGVSWVRRSRRGEAMGIALERVGLELPLDRHVSELDAVDQQLLGIALALMGEPSLLAVDDVGARLPPARQRVVWERLREVADSGVTVIATCVDPDPATDLADLVRLPAAG